jgi:hypothetical protein
VTAPGDRARSQEETVREDSDPASGATPTAAPIDVRLGRYAIRELLGRGGMGEVYLAHDPELDREVAIKVIRAGLAARSPEARGRFAREAQAMARLNHPNVVAVYDAGTVGETTYVAMELVDGPTLAAWLAEAPRGLDAILDVFEQAGRGLAAAHAAGITHRDFKPSNVMLGDRVRVVDFGIAEAAAPADEEPGTAPRGVLGTLAYMAPEQLDDRSWSPASDQYAFAVSLHEAVTGVRPGDDTPARAVPAWLAPVLERALERRPEARVPSMNALLAAIAAARPRPRSAWLATAAAATGAGALALGAIVAAAAWGEADPCTGAAAQLAGAWDEPRRKAVRTAFLGTGKPYADRTWQVVRAALDAYAGDWVDAHTAACRATRVDGRQTEAQLEHRVGCLDRARGRLAALTEQWIRGTDGRALDAAGSAATALPAIAACDDAAALAQRLPLPADPTVVVRIGVIRAELDRMLALSYAGQHDQLGDQLPPLVAAADATGWPLVRAEAHYLEGQRAAALELPAAEPELLEASRLATEARDDLLAAKAQINLVSYLADKPQSADRALMLAALADAALDRAGGDPASRAMLLRARGEAHAALDDLAAAERAYTEAHRIATAAYGAGSVAALEALFRLARIAGERGDAAESRRLAEQSLAGMTAQLGPEHPVVSMILNQLAGTAYGLNDYESAAGYMRRALAIVERTTGRDSLQVAILAQNLASVEFMRGQIEAADQLFARALAIRERELGPDDPAVASSLEGRAAVLQWRHQLEDALALLQRALGIVTKAYGPDHPRVAHSLDQLGAALSSNAARAEGLVYFERALALRRRVLGDDHLETVDSMVEVASALAELQRCRDAGPLLAAAIPALEQAGSSPFEALTVRGECELAGGDVRAAAATAQRAIAACEQASATHLECGAAYWVRARALDRDGRRADALVTAAEAERRWTAAESPEEAAEIRAWIDARARSRRATGPATPGP